MSTHHFHMHGLGLHRSEPVSIRVVVEGVAALVGLVALVGAACGILTWGLVRLATVLIS